MVFQIDVWKRGVVTNMSKEEVLSKIDTQTQVDTLYDAVSRVPIHRIFEEPRYENNHRPRWLILNGMLLKVAVRLKKFGPRPIEKIRPRKQLKTNPDELPDMSMLYPDVCRFDCIHRCGPYTSDQLTAYLRRFTDAVIPLVRLKGTPSEAYIRQNLDRVINYLVEKLDKGRLLFYRPSFSKSPKKNGALVFLDLSNPAEPFCLYPFFGLRFGYSCLPLWEPIQTETQFFGPLPRAVWTPEMFEQVLKSINSESDDSVDSLDTLDSDDDHPGFENEYEADADHII